MNTIFQMHLRLIQQCASLQLHTDQATAAPQTDNTTAEGVVHTDCAASLKPDSASMARGGTPKNSSAGDKPDLGQCNDEYNLFGGKSSDFDWLSLKHVSDQAYKRLSRTATAYQIQIRMPPTNYRLKS